MKACIVEKFAIICNICVVIRTYYCDPSFIPNYSLILRSITSVMSYRKCESSSSKVSKRRNLVLESRSCFLLISHLIHVYCSSVIGRDGRRWKQYTSRQSLNYNSDIWFSISLISSVKRISVLKLDMGIFCQLPSQKLCFSPTLQ
jgi:hypothetical protein